MLTENFVCALWVAAAAKRSELTCTLCERGLDGPVTCVAHIIEAGEVRRDVVALLEVLRRCNAR